MLFFQLDLPLIFDLECIQRTHLGAVVMTPSGAQAGRAIAGREKTTPAASGIRAHCEPRRGKRFAELVIERDGGAAMQISNLMTSDPVTVGPHDTLALAKSIMEAGHFRRVPVVDRGTVVGIVTERDLREHLGYLSLTRVSAAMRTSLITISPYDTVEVAARLMLQHQIGGLPIVDDGKLVGIVTTSDLLKALLVVVNSTKQIMRE
jgi:acetoin utilization protein AcuB